MHNMKKRITTIARYFAGTIAVMLITMSAIAQNQLTGKVSDSKDGTPVSGVTVTVKGTRVSTQTNPDGSYKITAPAGATALVFTSVGFARQEKAINGATVDVSFVNSSQQLNDVVIVGYGSVKKKDLTGSVSTVSAKDFNKGSFASPEQLIAGKAAGVSVISNGGGPGTGSSIRIRGGASLNASNNPLIV